MIAETRSEDCPGFILSYIDLPFNSNLSNIEIKWNKILGFRLQLSFFIRNNYALFKNDTQSM